MFIFNPQLLMIGVDTWWQLLLVVTAAIVAMLAFAAGTQGWFLTRSRWYESVLLLIVTFTLLRPGFWLDMALPRYDVLPAQTLIAQAESAPPSSAGLRVRIEGTTLEGKDVSKTVLLRLGEEGDGAKRIAAVRPARDVAAHRDAGDVGRRSTAPPTRPGSSRASWSPGSRSSGRGRPRSGCSCRRWRCWR